MKVNVMFLPLLLTAAALASPASRVASPGPPAVSGAFFALSVPDIKASTRWYVEKLGLRVVLDIPSDSAVAVTVLEGDGLVVELLQHPGAMPPAAKATDPARRIGITKVGFIVQDLDATLAALRAQNAEIAYGPYAMQANQRANVIVRDNAGNLVQIFGR